MGREIIQKVNAVLQVEKKRAQTRVMGVRMKGSNGFCGEKHEVGMIW